MKECRIQEIEKKGNLRNLLVMTLPVVGLMSLSFLSSLTESSVYVTILVQQTFHANDHTAYRNNVHDY